MNYEKQYKELLKETEEMKRENEEILTEYESTIKLLTETAEKYKEEKEAIELKYNLLSNTKKAIKEDLDCFKAKNKDKLKDIELLNKQINKLQLELSKGTEMKKLYERKIVTLENDNDHFITKLREQGAILDDLNCKLESSLEENILLQNDYEYFKHSAEEQLKKKEKKVEEMKSELLSKEKVLDKSLRYAYIKENTIKTKELRNSFKNKYDMNRKDDGFIKKASGSFYNIIAPFSSEKESSEKVSDLYVLNPIIKEGEEYNGNSIECNRYMNKRLKEKGMELKIGSFTFEIIVNNENELKNKKSKLKAEVVQNIKDILSKIEERKKAIIKDKTTIKMKLNAFGIKL